MSNIVPWNDQERMANAIAKSGLFGMKDPTTVLALMAVAQAEGRHPASVAKDYHIIQGRPALKADAMLARFQLAGGSVNWKVYTDEKVTGVFSHPQGGSLEVTWTMQQAKSIGLGTKDNWKNYPRAMLRARVLSEGIRSVYPAVLVGEYTPEEVQDFDSKAPKTLEATAVEIVDELIEEVAGEWTLYIPTADGTPQIYKNCSDENEFMAEYADLVSKIDRSDKFTQGQKDNKLRALEEANIKTLTALREQHGSAAP